MPPPLSRSANKALSPVRGVLKAAWSLGQLNTDAYRRAVGAQHEGLAFACGVVAMQLAGCDQDTGALGVVGKGNKERTVSAANGGLAHRAGAGAWTAPLSGG